MKITVLRTECANGRTCPQIAMTEDGDLLFQGRMAAEGPGWAEVWIPTTLTDGCDLSHLVADESGTLVRVRGERVTDAAVLLFLRVPEHEVVVRAAREMLPEVLAA
ncbi:hypothetical protein [Pseudonocardia sp. N23]|uniref:hypothetical protein n=1 Tax=Pseudonocardia sp. N23 TaxID=1987376 RepID=UPI000FB96C50|nr:hypothetical protein [Pseudonocardia sp. N23]RTL63151.1 MAG: hypothetical protein EKK42_29165 [Pseudonocardiaceae bacterium]